MINRYKIGNILLIPAYGDIEEIEILNIREDGDYVVFSNTYHHTDLYSEKELEELNAKIKV